MSGIPVLASKLSIPRLAPLLTVTERMRELCRRMAGRRAVILRAPAGYGKTTLMLTALRGLREEGALVRWYRLDEGDRDPAVFYNHLLEMLFPSQPTSDVLDQPNYVNDLICNELSAFRSSNPNTSVYLAFDDFHHVCDVPVIRETIGFLIDNLPDGFTMLVSSRRETNLLRGKRRLDSDVLEFTDADLRFHKGEVAALIESRYGFVPDEALLRAIMDYTEGWPAGVVLLCGTPFGLNAGALRRAVSRPRDSDGLFDYVTSEVLSGTDQDTVSFLVRLSVMSEFTANDARLILSRDDAALLLEKCHEFGFFVHRNGADQPIYRLHSLFREALERLLPSYAAEDEVRAIHMKAASHFVERGAFRQAIEHLIASGNVDLAVALISKESVRLIAFEATEQLRLWLNLLPDELIRGNGHLLYAESHVFFHKDPDLAMRSLELALDLFESRDDKAMQLYTLVGMSHLCIQRNDTSRLTMVHEKVKALSPPAPDAATQPMQAMLTLFDFTVAVWTEDHNASLALEERLAMQRLDNEWQWMCHFYSGQSHLAMGELEVAEKYVNAALSLPMSERSDLLMSYASIMEGMILQMMDDRDGLRESVSKMESLGGKHGYRYVIGFAKRLLAIDQYRSHDVEYALALLEESTDLFRAIGNAAAAASNVLLSCLWQCSGHAGQKGAKRLLPEARNALAALTPGPHGMCLTAIGHSAFGAIAREAGDFATADNHLWASIRESRAKRMRQVEVGALLHLARLRYAEGKPSAGDALLREALGKAKRARYLTFHDLHYPTLVALCAEGVQRDVHAEYARTLIARHYSDEAAATLAADSHAVGSDAGKMADAFLRRYSKSDVAPGPNLSATLLGQFTFSVDGRPVAASEWKTRKIAGVLKYLLMNRRRQVSRAQLMLAFWPDSDQKRASVSLRAALYELRKVLQRHGIATEGQYSIWIENRDSLRIRPETQLTVDVDEFEAYLSEWRSLDRRLPNREQKIELLEKAISLYRGDLLVGETAEDWAIAERERLRAAYLAAVAELADICRTQDGVVPNIEQILLRALEADPLNEEICLRLLHLYVSVGRRAQALGLYTAFAKRFRDELDLKPDPRLQEVIRKD